MRASRASSRAASAAEPRRASARPSATPCRRRHGGRPRAAGSECSASTLRASKASSRAASAAQPRCTSALPSTAPCRRRRARRLRSAGSESSVSALRTSEASSRSASAAQPRCAPRFCRRLRVGADMSEARGLRARTAVRRRCGEQRPPRERRVQRSLEVHRRFRRQLWAGADRSDAWGLRKSFSRAACAAQPRGASALPSTTPCRRTHVRRPWAAGSESSASTLRTSEASSKAASAAQPRCASALPSTTLRRRRCVRRLRPAPARQTVAPRSRQPRGHALTEITLATVSKEGRALGPAAAELRPDQNASAPRSAADAARRP
jgi:hypothetical protein